MLPLVSIQLGGAALEGVAGIFEQYVDTLVRALPGQEGEEEGKRKVSSQLLTLFWDMHSGCAFL